MQGLHFFGSEKLRRAGIGRSVVRSVGNQFLRFCFDHVFEKGMGQIFVGARGSDHQMVDPSGGVFFRNGLTDGEAQFSEVVGIQRPAHGQDDFMILEKIRQLSAGGPDLSNVGFQLDQFFLDGRELLIGQIVELRWVGFVVIENLRGHVNRREIIPNGNFPLVFRIPEDRPGIRRLGKDRGVVEERIRSPHEGHAIDLPVHFD